MADALILAAGRATRLEGLREQYAKANVPVGETTPLRFLLEALGTSFSDIWINLHFKGDQVREQAKRFVAKEVRLHFLEEPRLLGTGGTLLEMMQQNGGLPDLVVNAKMFTDFEFGSMIQASPGTMVLHTQSDLRTFGGLTFDAGHCISGLCGKQEQLSVGFSAAVFTGICKPSPDWIEPLKDARRLHPDEILCFIRHGLLPALAEKPRHANAQLHAGTWCEISTPNRVKEAIKQLGLL